MEKYEIRKIKMMNTNYLNKIARNFGERTASEVYFIRKNLLLKLEEKREN